MHRGLSWRILSALVLLLYAALVVLFTLFILQNFVIALVLGGTFLIFTYSAWLMFTGTGSHASRGRWLAVAATIALVAELLYFLFNTQDRRMILLLAGLTLLYLVLFGLLRRKYWAMQREQGLLGGNTAHFTNPYLIINPKAGSGRATKARIEELAQQQGIHVILTRKDRDVADSALEAVQAGADVIGISGGDGSIGAVAKVAIDHDLPIVVLPGGTRCHFARDLGLDPNHMADALAGFTGVERYIDVGEINGRVFLNNASFGLYADIVDHPNYREHKVQITRQVLQAIASGAKQPYDIRFEHEEMHIKRAVQVLVGINRYNTISLLELGHRQRLDEGVLQVTAVTELNDQLIKQLLVSMSMSQLTKQQDMPGIYQWVGGTLVVDSGNSEMVVGVDGEREVHRTPVEVRILPGALRIYVPAEGIRGRRKNPLSTSTIKQLLQNF